MGIIYGRSSDNRSDEILTENGLIISRNRVHLCETNVVFREPVPSKISIVDPVNDAQRMLNLSWLQSQHQFPINLQPLILMLKLPKALLVPMTTVIKHGQAE